MSEEILGRRTQRVSEAREGIGNRNQPGIGMGIGVGEDHAQAEMACGSKERKAPFPVSPTGESRGGRVPPTPQHAASQPKALSRIDAGGSPRKRDFKALSLKSPLRIPLLACGSKETVWPAAARKVAFLYFFAPQQLTGPGLLTWKPRR
jgi:hypothetical protein